MRSSLELFDLGSRTTTSVLQTGNHIEAPNWSPDGDRLIFNQDGLIYGMAVDGESEPEQIETGFAVSCNNDHGISPDGNDIVISDSTEEGESCIYVLPSCGGMPRRVTQQTPSWWHGWSPDGKTLAFTALRDGAFSIRTIATAGGGETVVVGGEGHYDGADYTPDGEWIWFNSSRSGNMQLWRVRPDGNDLEQMTHDERVNWFPHPSPDGKHIAYLAYEHGVEGHPAGKYVELRLMPQDGGKPETALSLFGGQGTINVPSWAPDGSRFAFVRYF